MNAEAYDNTTNQACSGDTGSSTAYTSLPTYVDFMGEVVGGVKLPAFSQVSESSGFYYLPGDTYGHYIGNNWTNAWYLEKTTNSYTCDGQTEYYNVCPSVPSSGSFSETWKDSVGF